MLAAGTGQAELRVVRSVGPSAAAYPAGRRLPDDFVFRLRRGDVIRLLSTGRGSLALYGPVVGTVASTIAPGRRVNVPLAGNAVIR
jgi:hypothetical protein